jgi:uncharacterized protein YwgA
VYLAELISLKNRESRLTNAKYEAYMHGAYSPDISDELEKLEESADTKADMHHGKRVTAFLGPDEDPSLSDETNEILDSIEKILRETRISNDDLGKWSKETWLYENTAFGKQMDFDNYLEQSEDLERDIEKLRSFSQ